MDTITELGTVTERVARGDALLDEHKPGWAERIDLGRLDVSDAYDCVLGQVFPPAGGYADGYYTALDDPDLGLFCYDRARSHGFAGASAQDDRLLDAEWARVITGRRVPA
jgi:hypothetical protein